MNPLFFSVHTEHISKQVELDANYIDASDSQQVWSFYLLICLPEIPLKYTSSRKKAIEAKLFWTYCCDLDLVWINSKL